MHVTTKLVMAWQREDWIDFIIQVLFDSNTHSLSFSLFPPPLHTKEKKRDWNWTSKSNYGKLTKLLGKTNKRMRKLPFFFRYSYPQTKQSHCDLGNEIANTHRHRGNQQEGKPTKTHHTTPTLFFSLPFLHILHNPPCFSSRCHAQAPDLTSASGELGTATATNPWEVPSFSRFSGSGSSSFPLFLRFFLPFTSCACAFSWLPTVCLIRVVNDTHSSTTKKNKEWQEKVPTVVLKAEEIMYSKANSEVLSLENAYRLLDLLLHCLPLS